jgi:polyhydroxyalkanoate synthesis regulator phasin
MVLDDIRKTFEAALGQLTPTKAQQLAKRFQPNAAKEQVSKTAGELIQLSQRMRDAVRREVVAQMRTMGVATQDEVDALRTRVRDLERAVGHGRSTTRKTTTRKTTTRKTRSRKTAGTATTNRGKSTARAATGRSASARPRPSAAS